MIEKDGCPDGMYPLDSTYEANYCDTFVELREYAERQSGVLNLPLSWWFDEDTRWHGDEPDWKPTFRLVFHSPRKHVNWSLETAKYDRDEVEAWLESFTKKAMTDWFGWKVTA